MTTAQSTRYIALHILAIAASNDSCQLNEIAIRLGLARSHAPVRLARSALGNSCGAGNWREARAEAEAKLRCGWKPPKRGRA